MHIEFETIYQNLSSNVHRGFDPGEKDWLLNRAVERFIDGRVKPHRRPDSDTFQLDSKSASDLHTILDDDNILPVDKYSDMVYRALMPGDFRYLVNARPYTLRSCDVGFDSTLTPTQFYYGSVIIPRSTAATPYQQVVLTVNGAVLFDITRYSFAYPLVDVNQRFIVTDLLRDVLSENGINFHWESYNGKTSSNTLYIEQGTAVSSITLLVDGTLVTGSVGAVTRQVPKPWTLTPAVYGKMSSARWTKNEDAYDLAMTPFFQSLSDSPITTFARGHLKVFGRDSNFVVTQVATDYIRQPRKINLALDRNCDLPTHTHPEICGIAAEIAMLYTQRPDWERKVQDNTARI